MSEHIRPKIQALIDRGNVTSAENAELRCNSWEREALVPVLDDQAFVERMQYALDNCFTPQRRPFATYNDAVEGLFAPELMKRFRSRLSFEQLVTACKNIEFDLTCGACAAQFFTGSSGYAHDHSCQTHSKALEAGAAVSETLHELVSHIRRECPGSDDPRDAVTNLREQRDSEARVARDYAETIDGVREALGQKATHYLCVAGDVKKLVEAVESRCDATLTLKRIRGESK